MPADCSGPVNCVTSLNMRKWMKDRLQGRKKKTPEPGSQPAPPPLQPAYFDAEQAPASAPQSGHIESSHHEAEVTSASEPGFEAQPVREASTAAESTRPPAGADSPRGRGRRRRGGRGRGGRGREQAVAQ